ncbi:MAG TPA: T9SS type A sorting domain-containing protein [Bacteroidetes bacterium]|nr:T9SS type A sorting domain-containing protein [Bacteroidota bacterium]
MFSISNIEHRMMIFKVKKVFDKKVASSFTKVDVSKLQSGIYFVNILKDDGTKVNKKVFIK